MAKILSSWKEIAHHFGKGVRTVQRWERTLALPIHRPSVESSVVFAIGDELDAWMQKDKRRPDEVLHVAIVLGPASDLTLPVCREMQQNGFIVVLCSTTEQARSVLEIAAADVVITTKESLESVETLREFRKANPEVVVTYASPLGARKMADAERTDGGFTDSLLTAMRPSSPPTTDAKLKERGAS